MPARRYLISAYALLTLVAVGVTLPVSSRAGGAQYSVLFPVGPSREALEPRALNNANSIVCGETRGPRRSYLLQGDQITPLASLQGPRRGAAAVAINEAGAVVGASFKGRTMKAVVWNGAEPAKLDNPARFGRSQCLDINDDGYILGSDDRGWWLRNGEKFNHFTGPFPGQGYHVRELGTGSLVIGGTSSARGARPGVWQNGVYSELPGLPGLPNGLCSGVNDAGDIVGYLEANPPYSGSPIYPVIWTDKSPRLLPIPKGFEGVANDINNKGDERS